MKKKGKAGIVFGVILLLAVEAVIGNDLLSHQTVTRNVTREYTLHTVRADTLLDDEYVSVKLQADGSDGADLDASDGSDSNGGADTGASDSSDGTDSADTGASADDSDSTAETSSAETEAQTLTPTLSYGGDTGEGTALTVAEASESSEYAQEGRDHTAYSAVDGDETTSWQEGEDGEGIGSWMEFRLAQESDVSYLTFKLGNWNTAKDYYHQNHRPEQLRITVGDQTWIVAFPDEMTEFRLDLGGSIRTDYLRFEVVSVYEGTVWDETCISEIGIYGTVPSA